MDCGEAAWILGRWHRNYYHWILYHLPRIMLLQDQGAERWVLIPGEGRMRPLIEASLEALGLEPASLRTAAAGPMRADRCGRRGRRFDPGPEGASRTNRVNRCSPSRRVYVSREDTAGDA